MIKKITGTVSLLFFISCSGDKSVTRPVRKDLVQAVYASGKIYPLNRYSVYSKLPGYVEKIHVKIGDTVQAGQPLITIRSEVSEKNVEIARNQYDLAQKNAGEDSPLLSALKQDQASARSKYELDSVNYTRYANLLKENAASGIQHDQAKTQFEISKQNYLKAKSTYISNRDRLRTELENARLQLEAQRFNRSDYIIASLVRGKVYDIVPKEGELVGNQAMLMEVGDPDRFEVELSVDETDISLLRKKQEVVYTIDAYEDIVLRGITRETYPRVNPSNKTSKVVADIGLGKDIDVFSGMSVEANIIISKKKNTLVIPREFLFGRDQIIRKEQKDTVKIKKGSEDLEFIEVLEGLDENTAIVKP